METQIKRDPGKRIKSTDLENITPFIWLNNQAEEAANFYTSIFNNSQIYSANRYGDEGANIAGVPAGTVMTVNFSIEGQDFVVLNGGPLFEISPAISFMVYCETPHEIDTLWEKLSEDSTPMMELGKYPFSERYGWIQDKFGVSWQLNLAEGTQKIMPCFLFVGKMDGKAEEAINFYTSLFKQGTINQLERYGVGESGTPGTLKFSRFSLNEQEFIAMDSNGNHPFNFTPGISFMVICETQQEIDHYWNNLTQGSDESAQQCGWLNDKYGVTWQIIPSILERLLGDPDPAKSGRVMRAMTPMKKIIIDQLFEAYNQ